MFAQARAEKGGADTGARWCYTEADNVGTWYNSSSRTLLVVWDVAPPHESPSGMIVMSTLYAHVIMSGLSRS